MNDRRHAPGCTALLAWDIPGSCTCGAPLAEDAQHDDATCEKCGHTMPRRDDLGGICIGCPCPEWHGPRPTPARSEAAGGEEHALMVLRHTVEAHVTPNGSLADWQLVFAEIDRLRQQLAAAREDGVAGDGACGCASATPTYPVFRSLYHVPPCPQATPAQHAAARGARELREVAIPAEVRRWREKGATDEAIEALVGPMRAQAARLEWQAINGSTADNAARKQLADAEEERDAWMTTHHNAVNRLITEREEVRQAAGRELAALRRQRDAIRTERDEARAQLADARGEAERWRFLRDRWPNVLLTWTDEETGSFGGERGDVPLTVRTPTIVDDATDQQWTGATPEEAIDAARASGRTDASEGGDGR